MQSTDVSGAVARVERPSCRGRQLPGTKMQHARPDGRCFWSARALSSRPARPPAFSPRVSSCGTETERSFAEANGAMELPTTRSCRASFEPSSSTCKRMRGEEISQPRNDIAAFSRGPVSARRMIPRRGIDAARLRFVGVLDLGENSRARSKNNAPASVMDLRVVRSSSVTPSRVQLADNRGTDGATTEFTAGARKSLAFRPHETPNSCSGAFL